MKRFVSAMLAAALGVVPAASAPRFERTTIAVGSTPERLLAVPAWDLVFVVMVDEFAVHAISTRDNAIVATVFTGITPDDKPNLLAYDGIRDRLVVATEGRIKAYERRGPGFVLVADSPMTFDVGAPYGRVAFARPASIQFDAQRDRFLLTDKVTDGIGIAEGRRLTFRIDLHDQVHRAEALVLDVASDRVIVPDAGGQGCVFPDPCSSAVSVLSASDFSAESRIYTIDDVFTAAVQSSAQRVYALWPHYNAMHVIDLNRGYDTVVGLGTVPWTLAVDEAKDVLYAGNAGSSFVSKLLGSEIDRGFPTHFQIALPGPARTVVLDAPKNLLYAVNYIGGTASVIDTASDTMVASYAVGAFPRFAVVDPETHRLYTADGSSSVTVLSELADPTLSELFVTPDAIPADETSLATITAFPKDGSGQPLGPGHLVTLSSTAGTLLGTVVDVGDGRYTQNVQATLLSETGIVTATADGERLAPRPTVAFTRSGWPQLRHVEPVWGIVAGGEPVAITGSGFGTDAGVIEVAFDGSPAMVLSVVDDRIDAITPFRAAPGVVDVSVALRVVDERRESVLRGGYTYVETSELLLSVTKDQKPDQVKLQWATRDAGPVRLEIATSRDFSTNVTDVAGLSGTGTSELAPSHPRLLFYRVVR